MTAGNEGMEGLIPIVNRLQDAFAQLGKLFLRIYLMNEISIYRNE